MLIERVVTIPAAPTVVWNLLIDPDRAQEWMPGVISYTTDAEEGAVGVVSTLKVKEGGKEVEYVSEILEWEPIDLLTIDLRGGSLGPNSMQVSYLLAPSGSGTALTYRSEWQAGSLMMWLMVPLIKLMAGRNATQAMERLGAIAARSGG